MLTSPKIDYEKNEVIQAAQGATTPAQEEVGQKNVWAKGVIQKIEDTKEKETGLQRWCSTFENSKQLQGVFLHTKLNNN